MRQNIKNFLKIIIKTFVIEEPIYEFGSMQVPEQKKGFADLRPFFPGSEYVGCDMRPGDGVDCITNLHNIALKSESVGTVLCFDTLEHVENPHQALKEIYRILKPDGVVFISSVMNFAIHDHPSDYWRFTPDAFRLILKPFGGYFVGFQGEKRFPHTIVGIGFKSFGDFDCLAFVKYYKAWNEV